MHSLRTATLAAFAALPACRGSAATADASPERAVAAGVTLDLTPEPDKGALSVEVHVNGELASRVRELVMARRWADAPGAESLGTVTVRDGRGDLATKTLPDGGNLRLALDHPAAGGEITVSYRTRAEPREGSHYGLRLSREQLSGVGHTFLLLPRFDSPAPVRVRWHLAAMNPGSVGACSLGSGDEVTGAATTEELAHAVYVAGKLDFVDGGDGAWTAIVGPKSFEPSSAFVWTKQTFALVRAAVDPDAGAEPFSFFFVAEPGFGTDHDGAAFGRSFAMWFDAKRPFDDDLKIAVAHELAHRVFGTKVRLDDDSGSEARWFSEGFATHYARKVLFASKRISADAFVEDVKRSESDAGADGRALDQDRPREPFSRDRSSYGKGALYAASLDAAVKKASHGARTLDDLVRELVSRAEREGRPALPTKALRELVLRELGPTGGEEFDRVLERGEPPHVSGDAFGPCFERANREVKAFDLGFDRASLDSLPGIAHNVEKGSNAEHAGLTEGALVVAAKVPPPDAKNAKVELTVADKKGPKKIRYRPETRRIESAWQVARCSR